MARAATSPELTLFRTPGQWTRYRAAIFPPSTVYTGRINGSISPLDKVLVIPYDGGSGTLANVLPDMTVYIGSTAGAWDKGIARVRSIDSDEVFIGETSDIRFANDDYLTIVNDFGLWARPVLISAGVAYMDGGIAYSDQHTNYLPLIRGGPDRVLRKTGSTVSAVWDFPATVPGSSVSSRSTSAPGASAISGGTTQTPTTTWNSVGWKQVFHTVTAANGKSSFIVRNVFVWDESNAPEPIELGPFRGDTESGGWEVSLTLYDAANLSEVRDRAHVIIFAEDHYGSTEDEIGPVSGSENIVFNGWIAKESIDWKSEGGAVSFTAYGAHYWLQKIPAWPDGVEFTTATPSKWTQIKNLTVDLGLVHHFLMWRTTAPRIMDIFPTGDTRLTKEVSSLASDLWSQIREMAFDQIFARALVNRLGQLYIQVHPQLIPLASRSHPTVTTFLEKDLEDPIELGRAIVDEASIVDLSGVLINSSGRATAFFSLSPGHSHSHYGNPVVINRLLLSSQAQANQLAGLYRGWINNPYDPITLKLSGNDRLIDICPLQKCAVSISSGDTIREISESLGLIPLTVEEVFDPQTGYSHQEITFEAETFEDLSTNGDVPGSGDVSIPPLPPLPPLPPIDILIPGVGTTTESAEDPSRVLVHDESAGLIYTETFDEASPSWGSVNSGLTLDQYQGINHIAITPSGGIYVSHRRSSGFGAQTPFIAYAPSIGATFEIIEDQTSIQAKLPTSFPATWGVNALGVDPLTGLVAYVIGVNEKRALFIGSGTSFAEAVDVTTQIGVGSVGNLSFGFGNWRLTGQGASPKFLAISSDGSTIVRDVTVSGGSMHHVPISSSEDIYMHIQTDISGTGSLVHITQNGAIAGDFTTLLGTQVLYDDHLDNKIAVDPSGMYLFLPWDTGQRGRSSDGGATISGIPTLPFGGKYAYAYAGGLGLESRWVAAKGIIRYSPDFGENWDEKAGDINGVAPILSLNIVKVLL
jgi:hypothetical protein